MRFLTTEEFLDRNQQNHPAGAVLDFPNDSKIIPSPSWRPLDSHAKERLESVSALKVLARKAAEDEKTAIEKSPKYEIVDEPAPVVKGAEKPLTIKEAAMGMGASAEKPASFGGKRAADRKP